jgi:hypothetical protein
MALSRRRGDRGGLDAWPGYVDALSTLLMVIIFVLLVFVLAQGFLGAALTSRDEALERLNRQVTELSDLLNLERTQVTELRATLGRTVQELRDTAAARDRLALDLRAAEQARAQLTTERDTSRAEHERATARIAELEQAARGAAQRLAGLETRLTDANARAERAGDEATRTMARLGEATRALEAERGARTTAETQAAAVARNLAEAQRQLEAMRAELAELNRTVRADRATIEMRLADLARLSEQIRALTALRDRLEAELRTQGEASQQATRLADSAQAQVALLSRQIDVVADASGWAQLVQDGQFRLLTVWAGARMPRFPDAPTLREVGLDMVIESPYGLAGPRGMDPAVVARLHDALKEALFDPATREVMARFNMPMLYAPTAEYDANSRRQNEIEKATLRRHGLLAPGAG